MSDSQTFRRISILFLLVILAVSCRGPAAPEIVATATPPGSEAVEASPSPLPPTGATSQPPEATPTSVPPAAPQTFEISINDNEFTPAQLTIPAGSTVVWTHNGGNPHTVTADDGSFDSGELSGGGALQHTFDQPGTFPYHCEIHGETGGQGMSGTITVEPAAEAPPPETAAPTQPEAAAPATTEPPDAGSAFTLFPAQVNRDVSQPAQRPGLAFGATAGTVPTAWITWAEDSGGGARQIFASELVSGALQVRGASLNLHINVTGDAPTITFAGENRAVPWVAWVEPSPGFGNVSQVFASRFNATSGLWQPAGQDRGGGEPSLNLHTNRTSTNPFIFSGSADPTSPTVPWVAWEELSSLSNFEQIFVSRGVRDDTGLGGFIWEVVGQENDIQEPSLNVDRFRRGLHPTGVFAETGNAVPWVTWHESGASRPERIFTARGVADANSPGGFRWINVPACEPDEVTCALNINPLKDGKDASMAAGNVNLGEASVPWIAWAEIGPTGKWQVFVSRLDPSTRNSFLQVGGSLNVDQNQDARTPLIVFVANTPYVAWLEDDGSGKFLVHVRHLASDPQTGTWSLDSPPQGLNANSSISATHLAAAGSPESLFLAWVEGDPAAEATQVVIGQLAP